jgi:uncharacterized protein (TIGR02611 family)
MDHLKRGWRRTPRAVRLPIVFIVGWLVVLVGIIDLPLPGPGWVIIFVGFAILATEFTSAAKVRDWLVSNLKVIAKWFKQMWRRLTRH